MPSEGVGSLFIRVESLNTLNDKEPTAPSFEMTRHMAVVSRVALVINAPFRMPRVALLSKEGEFFRNHFYPAFFAWTEQVG